MEGLFLRGPTSFSFISKKLQLVTYISAGTHMTTVMTVINVTTVTSVTNNKATVTMQWSIL